MGTFAEFLAADVREEIVLAELEPTLVVTGWSAVGVSAPNTYQATLAPFVGTSAVPGGVFRQVIAVRENATALTARTSLATVDANAGSWWWDGATLYVRSTSGADPDVFTAMAVDVRFRVATAPVVLNETDGDAYSGRYYAPWIAGDLPSLVQEIEDALTGRKSTEGGSLRLTNGHAWWHQVVAPEAGYTWVNKPVRFLLGGRYADQVLLRSQYAPLATMLIDRVGTCDDVECTFLLRPLARRTDVQVPITPFFESAYPRLGDGVRGTYKWVGYGRAWIRPDLTDTAGAGTWTIADAAVQTLYRVHQVDAVPTGEGVRVPLTEGQHYTVNLTACTVTVIDPAFGWQAFALQVDVTGKPGGVRGYLSTFGEIVSDLLTTFAGVATADLDAAAFTAVTAQAPQELAVWLKSPRSVASLLATEEPSLPCLERSVMGTVQQTRAGLWTISVWRPPKDTSTLRVLRKEQFARFSPRQRQRPVFSSTQVFYAYDHARDAFKVTPVSDARRRYLTSSTAPVEVYTFLRQDGSAEVLAKRLQYLLGRDTIEAEFEDIGNSLADASPGEEVLVTYAPAPHPSGAYASRCFELVRLERFVTPRVAVGGVMVDLDHLGLVKNVGVWMGTGSPTYAAASAAQRELSGFWCNSAGDPGDVAFAGRSRWM